MTDAVAIPAHEVARSMFDKLRQEDENGEWWSARDLMPLYGYNRWDKFKIIIERAKTACAGSAYSVTSNFIATNLVDRHRNKRPDYRVSRYAAYLMAMEGDATKSEVARAKTYFAIQTRRAEVELDGLDDDLVAIQQTLTRVQQLRDEQRRMKLHQMQQDQLIQRNAQQAEEAKNVAVRAAKEAEMARKEIDLNRKEVRDTYAEMIKLTDRVSNVEEVTPLRDATGLQSGKEAGQLLGYGLVTFYEVLRELKIIYRDKQQGGHKLYQKYMDADWGKAIYEPWAPPAKGHSWTPYFTPKGVVEISKLLKKPQPEPTLFD